MILIFAGLFGYYVSENMATQDFKQWNGFWHEWKTEATSGITKSCNGFWDIVYDCRKWLTCAASEKGARPSALWHPFTPIVCQHWWWLSPRCAAVVQFCVASSKEGPVLSLQLPLLLASSFREAVPLASLVRETTALQFKLQVAVYLDHNYPQHFHYKTLGLVLWNLPFGWRNMLHTTGFCVCLGKTRMI